MTKDQVEYGIERLDRLAKRWGITPFKTADILLDVRRSKEFYEWVNADTFLNKFIYDGVDKMLEEADGGNTYG